jgi:DNA polymerase-1
MGKYKKVYKCTEGKNPHFAFKPHYKKYKVIETVGALKKLARKMEHLEEFAFDTETNTLRVFGENSKFRCVCITISWGEYDNYYIPMGHRRYEDYGRNLSVKVVRKYLGPIFSRPDVRLVGQNIKFDLHVLARLGIHTTTTDIWDTMILSWLCDENTPNGLKENSAMKLGLDQSHFADTVATVPNEVKKEFGLKASNKATYDLVLIDDGAPYALDDSYLTWELYLGYINLVDDEKMTKIYTRNYQPFLQCLFKMEERGVVVDTRRLDEMQEEIAEDMEDLEYKMFELAGVEFNPNSSQHLAELFFGYEKPAPRDKQGNLKRDKNGKVQEAKINWNLIEASFRFRVTSTTDAGAPSTSADTFWNLSHMTFKNKHKQSGVEVAKLLVEYKKLSKLRSAFIDGLKAQIYDDGKAHPSFNIIGTDSGRISCSEPNLQQLPKADEEDKYQIRSLFIGSVDPVTKKRKKIIACDFSNLEMRVLAHFSEDKNLLEMFATGADTHGSTAVNMFNLDCDASEVKKQYPHLRQAAKVINFLLMYGGGAPTLYDNLRSDHYSPIDLGAPEYLKLYKCKNGVEVAQVYIDKYFDTYSGVAKFIRDQKKFAKRNGYVQTLLRRKRRLPDINSSNFGMKSYAERLAINSTIQGSAADITSSAQNRVDADPWFLEHRCLMIIQVHDELVFECPEEYVEEAIPRIQALMAHPFGDNVELNLALKADADQGDSYQEAK